ncbi:MAG: FAD-binding protein, partial [Nitrospirales bacterium]
ATAGELAKSLAMVNLALPLPNEPLKSIVSCLINEQPSLLTRSLGSLSEYTHEIRAVGTSGETITFRAEAGVSCLNRCRASNSVITEIVFHAVSADSLWLVRRAFHYPGQQGLLTVAGELFTADGENLEKVDLILDAYNADYEVPVVSVTAVGSDPQNEMAMKRRLEVALASVRPSLDDIVQETIHGAGVLARVAEFGLKPSLDPMLISQKLDRTLEADAPIGLFLETYSGSVHEMIAFGPPGTGKLRPELLLFSRLQVNRANLLQETGYMYTTVPPIDTSTTAPRLETVLASTLLRRVTTERRATPLRESAPSLLFFRRPPGPIPNFEGDVYQKGDRDYESKTEQYATSSFPPAQMSPFMVAYPRHDADVAAAIAFAKKNGKRIVARSGGHSYSGKSSGGSDTIVLSMDAFADILISDHMAEVGPAVKLTTLARAFKGFEFLLIKRPGITIPHGECPMVCIGGHAQTGGYGHLLRGFGLAQDRVQAIDIITADGRKRFLTRPAPGNSPLTEDETLFWGVLGGNAGSFGVVTNYRLECVRDTAHPHSYGFAMTRTYRKTTYALLMKEAQKWTQQVEAGTLKSGIDFMMSVASADGLRFFPVMLIELVHSNLGGDTEIVDGDAEFSAIITAANQEGTVISTRSGPRFLSYLSDDFVRRGLKDGREFEYPYKKRVNTTSNALTDAFVDGFVDLVDEAVNTDGVKLIFQMGIGGGVYRNSDRRAATSIPHRDYVFCLVYDLFYQNGHEADAEALQRKMQQLVDAHFSPDQEQRAFWGSFGDTNMADPTIRKMYYDNDGVYKRLQELKRRVDPDDIFHTNLSVQLPAT